ncbi:MAG: hypothetical protein R3257_05140 [bacterium]|nr:hypothetical protein [bacterium]
MSILKSIFSTTFLLFALVAFGACATTDTIGGNCSFSTLDPATFDLNGTWTISESTVTSDDPECFDMRTFTLEVNVSGNTITAFSPDLNASFSGEISGNQIKWTGSFPDGAGTSTVLCMELTASSASSVSGTSSWEFVENGFECSGSSQISGTKTSS